MAPCPETRAAATAALEDMIASGVLLPLQAYHERVSGTLKGVADTLAPLSRHHAERLNALTKSLSGTLAEPLARIHETMEGIRRTVCEPLARNYERIRQANPLSRVVE